jgi:hypothetical protein
MRLAWSLMIFLLSTTASLLSPSAAAADREEASDSTPRILVLDLKAVGASAQVAHTVSASVAVQVGRHKTLQVVSDADVRRIADLAAERSIAGCDNEQCLTELAGAIGADYVVFGEVGRVDELTVITLGVLDYEKAAVLSRETLRGEDLSALLQALDGRVDRLLAGAGLIAPVAPSLAGPAFAIGGGVLIAAGGTAIGVGLLPTVAYNDAAERVRTATNQRDLDRAQADVAAAQSDHNSWGLLSIVGGAVVVVAGIVGAGVGVAFIASE